MADIVIAAADVVAQSNSRNTSGRAGVAIAAGELVYLDSATSTFLLADADFATAQTPGGIALNSAAANQPLAVHLSGDIAVGAVLTAGARYYLSSNPGKLAPEADLSTGENIALIGIAKSASVLSVKIHAPGVTVA